MSTMIERVALAILAKDGEQLGYMVDLDEAKGIARAAIAAMREPTEKMLEAVEREEEAGGYCSSAFEFMTAEDAWPVMIHAALNEEG